MVSVAEAEKIILANLFHPKTEKISLDDAHGKILAEEIKSDRDLPPFNRATMDGIAISFQSIENNQTEFLIEGIQAAGQPQQSLQNKKSCIEIMTGAPLPKGTDCVIPYENVKIENEKALLFGSVKRNQFVHSQGSDAKQDETLLNPGFKLSAAEIALLASVGKSEIFVFKNPSVAIISTGDELVDVTQTPLPHQIRKSNSHTILAALGNMQCNADIFHIGDDKQELKERLQSILTDYELILFSGGVSKGKFDFIPGVLESLGVTKLLHEVSQRPGKPMWVGLSERNFVFALPGNPVATFMCFHRYVKPWLTKSLGAETKKQFAVLAEDFKFIPQLTYFLQVKIQNENGTLMAFPVVGGGSGDFANLKDVDGFLELPREGSEFKSGEIFLLIQFR